VVHRDALPARVVCPQGRVKGRVEASTNAVSAWPEAGRRRGTVGGCSPAGALPANHKAAQQRQTKVFPYRLRGVQRPTMRAVDLASLVGTQARFSNLGCRASKGIGRCRSATNAHVRVQKFLFRSK